MNNCAKVCCGRPTPMGQDFWNIAIGRWCCWRCPSRLRGMVQESFELLKDLTFVARWYFRIFQICWCCVVPVDMYTVWIQDVRLFRTVSSTAGYASNLLLQHACHKLLVFFDVHANEEMLMPKKIVKRLQQPPLRRVVPLCKKLMWVIPRWMRSEEYEYRF